MNAPMYGMYAVTNVTSAIVPASGTSRISAPIPTTAALKAATIVTPRKYLRIATITLAVIRLASSTGKPMCRLTHRRIPGPPVSRKKRAKTMKVMKKMSEVRPRMPSASPWSSVFPPEETAWLMSCLAGPVRFASASWYQPSTWSPPLLIVDLISPEWSVIPPITNPTTTTTSAIRDSTTIAAPSPRLT